MGTNQKRRKRNKRQAILVLLLIAALVLGARYFIQWRAERDMWRVTFENRDGSLTPAFKIEVAADDAKRRKGLMFVKEMPQDFGMLFVYPEEKLNSMWMKNTYLPLDMIFLDSSLHVVGVLPDVPILNEKRRQINLASKYIIEFNAGTALRHQIKLGSLAKFNRPLPEVS